MFLSAIRKGCIFKSKSLGSPRFLEHIHGPLLDRFVGTLLYLKGVQERNLLAIHLNCLPTLLCPKMTPVLK